MGRNSHRYNGNDRLYWRKVRREVLNYVSELGYKVKYSESNEKLVEILSANVPAAFKGRKWYDPDPRKCVRLAGTLFLIDKGINSPECLRVGSVYFIGPKDRVVVKIGYSKDVNKRLADLQTASPFELYIHKVLPHKSLGDEKEFHRRFKHLNSYGEWFKVKKELAEFLSE